LSSQGLCCESSKNTSCIVWQNLRVSAAVWAKGAEAFRNFDKSCQTLQPLWQDLQKTLGFMAKSAEIIKVFGSAFFGCSKDSDSMAGGFNLGAASL
jgi:hypothetical protein